MPEELQLEVCNGINAKAAKVAQRLQSVFICMSRTHFIGVHRYLSSPIWPNAGRSEVAFRKALAKSAILRLKPPSPITPLQTIKTAKT